MLNLFLCVLAVKNIKSDNYLQYKKAIFNKVIVKLKLSSRVFQETVARYRMEKFVFSASVTKRSNTCNRATGGLTHLANYQALCDFVQES